MALGGRLRGEGVNRPRAAGRHLRVELTLSTREADELTRRATATGVSRARYLIEAALDRPDTIAERRSRASELWRTERVMRGLATKVDLLAGLARSSGRMPDDMDETLASLREASAAVMAMARAAGNRPEDSP